MASKSLSQEQEQDLAEGPDRVGMDHATSTPTNLAEGSGNHCPCCGRFTGSDGSCRDCFPALKPNDAEYIDYILDAMPVRAWMIIGLTACLFWGVVFYGV